MGCSVGCCSRTSSWCNLVAGTTPRVVMLLLHAQSDTESHSCGQTCAFLQWPVSKTTCRSGMQAALRRLRAEGRAGSRAPRAPKGSINRPWPSEPAPWPSTTPSLSSRTASPSTALSSSSARITWFGSTPRESLSGHILYARPFTHVAWLLNEHV